MPETPAVDLDAIRARLDAPRDFEPVAFDGTPFQRLFTEDEVRGLLGMVDTLTTALEPFARANYAPAHPGQPMLQSSFWKIADVERARAVLAGTSPTPPGSFDNLAGGIASDTAAEAKSAESPTPPTGDLAALADRWDDVAAENEARGGALDKLYTQSMTYRRHAAELRAALGVPRSAGHKEDPVMSATPGTWRVGRRLGRTIYRDDQLVGLLDTVELAEQVVAAMNVPVGGAPTTEPGCCDNCGVRFRPHIRHVPDGPRTCRRVECKDCPVGEPHVCVLLDPDTTGGDHG